MKSDADAPRPTARTFDRGIGGASSAEAGAVRVSRPFHAWLHYDVLRHVTGAANGGSLHDRGRPWRPWIQPLAEAIRVADDARVQALPLDAADYAAMYQRADDDALGRALRDAWTLEYHRVSHAWQVDEGYGARLERFWQQVAEPLRRCRRVLWQGEPCALSLFDVPPLGRHVRSWQVDDTRVIALDLSREPGELVARIIYEEARAGTADGVMQRYAALEAGQVERTHDDWSLHMTLDAAAARRAEQVIEREAPQILSDFRRWHGQPSHGAVTPCD